ncbi:Hypothetical protein Mal4_49180 [Maioricimonas rarisocia]|uniref:Ribonuclease n=1 Tax=Maioricimonas rarisocia TaxID=2528026 RepID=A0A517ZDP6_9PLAN|nr:hypothetical protein [Maioricimonas rarisocia]QDU40560.1 Hypothetical protein Mal4_49180 [Maioricimonas rarisocia]
MGLVCGMDEAGYGPNLGPLVIVVSCWEVPDGETPFDFWTALEDVITQAPTRGDQRLHVADSKQVHNSQKGLERLERSVLSLLGPLDAPRTGLNDLCRAVCCENGSESPLPPWCSEDVRLPHACAMDLIETLAGTVQTSTSQAGVRLQGVFAEVVHPATFNGLLDRHGSKGIVLSTLSLQLLARAWSTLGRRPAEVVADKHGGRDRYADLLCDAFDGQLPMIVDESRHRSRYRVAGCDVTFTMKAESHFPVAVASMVAKYLRELEMERFNRFWRQFLPDVRPTKGYPVDARRFLQEIAPTQRELEIAETILWRRR